MHHVFDNDNPGALMAIFDNVFHQQRNISGVHLSSNEVNATHLLVIWMQSIRQVTPGVELIRVVPDFYPSLGGSIIHTAEAARRINLHLAKQIILAPMNPPESEKRGEFNGIPIIRLPSRNREICGQLSLAGIPVQPFVVWTYAWQVAKAIGNVVGPSDEHTIVHVHGTLLGAMVCLLMPKSMRNIPVVITQDSANPLRISKRERITTWLALLLLTLRKPSLLIVVDDGSGIHQFGRILQRKGIPYQVVNHAIDVPKQADTEEGKRREFVILSTSRLVTFKRVDLAVLGFAEFYRSIGRKDGIRFVIIGDGPERDKLEKIVKEHELDSAVRFEGWKNHKEVLEALSRSDVVVGTSLISNLNLSIQEAMAAGCAVVVFDNG
jgi:glycosyltransferase involved in cell wall biosynthesis